MDLVAELLLAYSASARVNQYLVEQLHPAVWRARPPEGGPRRVAALVAHMHNCGLRYLERTDPAAPVPQTLDRHRVKRKAVLGVVGAALAGNGKIIGFPGGAVKYLTYYMVHDAHHRGQIMDLARRLGHPISRRTMAGMWEWSARARE